MADVPVDADHPSTAGRVVCVGPALGPVANALEACGHRVDHVEDFPTARRTLGDAVAVDGVRVLCAAATLEDRDQDRRDDVWSDVDVTVPCAWTLGLKGSIVVRSTNRPYAAVRSTWETVTIDPISRRTSGASSGASP